MVRINCFEVQNVKKVRAVTMQPSATGLTVIGGKSEQGKTSILDAIVWALGGDKYKPSNPNNGDAPPSIRIELDNGLIVERSGKNSALKVTDSKGMKAGQSLLNELISQLALDLPKFMSASGKEKAEVLLQVIGVGDKLAELDAAAKQVYDQRHAVGINATRAKKHAESLPVVVGAPDSEVSASDLIQQQQAIHAQNRVLAEKREQLRKSRCSVAEATAEVEMLKRKLREAETSLAAHNQLVERYAEYNAVEDESDSGIVEKLEKLDELNRKYRDSKAKLAADTEAKELQAQYDELTVKLNSIRESRKKLLDGADLPLPELSVIDGEIVYRGQKCDCMSGAEQLRVAVAIVRKLKPDCNFVLIDKSETMDVEMFSEFGQWAEENGLQVIATRVSTGEECSVIIEDGCVK